MYDDFAHHNVNQIVWILAEEGACYMRPFARRPPQFGQIPQDFGARLPRDIPDGWIQLVIWKLKAISRTFFGSHSRKQENHQSYMEAGPHFINYMDLAITTIVIIWSCVMWSGNVSSRFKKGHVMIGTYLIIVIFFTLTQFLENKIYTQKTRKLRQNTQ